MKKVFVKYNPYKLETEIKVDGYEVKENSELRRWIGNETRFQDWVEKFPQILIDEQNDTEFEITFNGTILDYEDLILVFANPIMEGKILASFYHIPAKETNDKAVLIEEVFKEIQEGPFEELRSREVIDAFEKAKSTDFEICIVATMSAGKSTLINAMLSTRLMPSTQEACTAVITRIKDADRDDRIFRAEVYGRSGKLQETQEDLKYEIMERLNSDKSISEIRVEGNIPFVQSDDVSLVLIDTPGPNSARYEEHKEVQERLLRDSSKPLILYIMTGEYGTTDDSKLLNAIADSMAVGGKQSKDRFLFVVNKLDGHVDENDGPLGAKIERIRSYLENHKIVNPNIFPVTALTALNIRLLQANEEITNRQRMQTDTNIELLNIGDIPQFDSYAPLPPSIRDGINKQIDEIKALWTGGEFKNPAEALIHTGVVSLEAAIRQYVQKYAKTAKIKNIRDTFMRKIEAEMCFEETKSELAKRVGESEKIVKNIEAIQEKASSIEEAQKYKSAVYEALETVKKDSTITSINLVQKFQSRISERSKPLASKELDIESAQNEIELLVEFALALESDFKSELTWFIENNLVETSDVLLNEYKRKLSSLTEEIDVTNMSGITIDPLKLMEGSINVETDFGKKFEKEKRIEDGEEWVYNMDKKWYKPWTWLQEEGYYRKKYKQVRFIDGSELAQEFFEPVERELRKNKETALDYAILQSEKVAKRFSTEFANLDNVFNAKMEELKSYATDKDKADKRIKESEKKLTWLNEISTKVESILEI